MSYLVLMLWLIQAGVGLSLLVTWLRRGSGHRAATVLTHVGLSLAGLACWWWFAATGAIAPAWIAFALITIGNGYGDVMLLARARRISAGAKTLRERYRAAIAGILRGQLPPRVSFHAVFSGLVYFSCLGWCIGATVSAGGS